MNGTYYYFEDTGDPYLYGRIFTADELGEILRKPGAVERDFVKYAADREEELVRVTYRDGERMDEKTLCDPSRI